MFLLNIVWNATREIFVSREWDLDSQLHDRIPLKRDH